MFSHSWRLKQLSLNNNAIIDIEPLSELSALEILDLEGNQIRDIGLLTALWNLEELYLADNPIQDTTPLLDMAALCRLSLDEELQEEDIVDILEDNDVELV